MKTNIIAMVCALCFAQILNAQDIKPYKSSNNLYGLEDQDGKVVIAARYGWMDDEFKDGLIKVNRGCSECDEVFAWSVVGGKWGFINAKGKEIVSIKYDRADDFREGFSRIRLGKKWGFVNLKGKEAIPLIYDNVYDFEEGFAIVAQYENNSAISHSSFIDKKGKLVIPYKYDDMYSFSGGLANVVLNGRYGFIDTKGKEVIPLKYDWADSFSNGKAKVKLDNKEFTIDTNGNEISN